MTAIAYRDGVMAADTQVTDGYDMICGHMRKIARSPSGTLGAASGRAGVCAEFRRWIEAGVIDGWIAGGFGEPLALNQEAGAFGALIVTVEGQVIHVDWQGRAVEMGAPFHAEGCGPFLAGAMAAGADAETAVRIAILHDAGCGGEVQVERIGPRTLPAFTANVRATPVYE